MRLREYDDSRDAVREKAVESDLTDFGVCFESGGDHRRADVVDVIYRGWIAAGQLAHDVRTKSTQFSFSSALAGKSHLQARRLARAVHLRPRPFGELYPGVLLTNTRASRRDGTLGVPPS